MAERDRIVMSKREAKRLHLIQQASRQTGFPTAKDPVASEPIASLLITVSVTEKLFPFKRSPGGSLIMLTSKSDRFSDDTIVFSMDAAQLFSSSRSVTANRYIRLAVCCQG